MHNPCMECYSKYGHSYIEVCDSKCQYAKVLSILRKYGGLEKVIDCMEGRAVQVALLKKENIDYTYAIVSAAKEGVI